MFRFFRVSVILSIVLMLALPLAAGKPADNGKPPGGPPADDRVNTEIDTLHRLSGDGLGDYQHEVDGVRSIFADGNLLLALSAFSSSSRTASVDLNYPVFDPSGQNPMGVALGVSTNNTLQLNVRGNIALMAIGDIEFVPGQFSITSDADGRPYRVNFSGGNGTDLVRAERVSDTVWILDAAPGSLARVWDVTRNNKPVLIGLYLMDFHIVVTDVP